MSKQEKNIYQRKDGTWEGCYLKRNIGGKNQFGYVFGKTYEEVESLLKNVIETRGLEYSSINDTFLVVSTEWLCLYKSQLKYSSIVKYSNILNLYLIPEYGNQRIHTISRNDVMQYSSKLLSSGGKRKSGLSPKMVNSILSVMKSVFEYATREKNLILADIKDISMKQSQKSMRILSRTEQHIISKYLYENLTPCHLGILLCLYTGLRIGEICALKWEDIFLEEQYISVNKAMQRVQILEGGEKKTKVQIDMPKSNCSIRKIPIPDEILHLLIQYQKQDMAFLLTGMVQSYIEPRTMENRFKAVIKECKINDVNFHALRHTFATRCIELGFDIKSLSEILGHASVNITLNRYVHPSMELKQKNMNMLSGLLLQSES